MFDRCLCTTVCAILACYSCSFGVETTGIAIESSSNESKAIVNFTHGYNQSKIEEEALNATALNQTTTPRPPPIGDPSYCTGNATLLLMPGYGWDNLKNEKMKQIFRLNYSQCSTAADRRYFIPNGMVISVLNPIREEIQAALFQHWNTFVSSTTDSLNKRGDSLFDTPALSGSFTLSYQRVKESLVKDKAITSRVKLSYPFFTVGLSLKSRIGDEFQRDIRDIAEFINSRKFLSACYFSELLITKYGTHYVDQIELGASISQEDSLLRSVLNVSSLEMQTEIVATAVAFFLKGVGMSLYKPTTLNLNSADADQYLKARLTSLNLSSGGRFPPNETSLSGWLESISSNLAVIQQDGKPIYELITDKNFPHLGASTRDKVRQKLEDALREYYELNYHKGCTNPDSPNFSYQALKDDGSCKLLRKPYIFGGVYQTCDVVRSDAGDLCINLTVKNPINDELKCGNGFQRVFLYSSNKTTMKDGKICTEECSGLWLFRTCKNVCTNTPSYSRATYKIYWCVAQANGSNVSSPGLKFGGVFNSIRSNPITNGKTCPTGFDPVTLSDVVTVCIAKSNPETDSANNIVFGGFYTCSEGNPLSEFSQHPVSASDRDLVEVQLDSEGATGGIAVNRGFPRQCPTGYATYKIPTLDECNIYYCINNIVSYKNFTPPVLISPPFCAFNPNNTVPISVTLPLPEKTSTLDEYEEDVSTATLPSDVVGGIIMAIFLFTIIIGIGFMIYLKKKNERRNSMFHDDYKELID